MHDASRHGSAADRAAPNGGMTFLEGFLPIVAFLVTAWLLSLFVDWCYRTGIGPDETLTPEPAHEPDERTIMVA